MTFNVKLFKICMHSWDCLRRPGVIGFLLMSLLLVSGCMKKVEVTYIPKRVTPVPNQKTSHSPGDEPVAVEGSRESDISSQERAYLQQYFTKWQGVRYKYGGSSTKGVDCSGLTLRAYKDLYGLNLPRTVARQARKGTMIKKSSLRPGDLVFFKTGRHSRHVGIYLGENQFIHASRSKGVTQSSLDNVYWKKKYWLAKRLQMIKS